MLIFFESNSDNAYIILYYIILYYIILYYIILYYIILYYNCILLKKDFTECLRNKKPSQPNTLQQILKTHPDRNFCMETESRCGWFLFSQRSGVMSCQLN